MLKNYRYALFGYLLMLFITTLVPLIFDSEQLQSLIIFPIILIFVYSTKMSVEEMGLTSGTRKDYLLGLLYPVSVCFSVFVLAWLSGNLGHLNYPANMTSKIVTLFFMTFILAFTTEEGFFRGWLFGILERTKMSPKLIIVFTALSFSLWHLPLFLLDPGFISSFYMLPLYLSGGIIAGMIFGLLRYKSGSIIVTSFSHALWNTMAYTLFGVGSGIGILGITSTNIYDPERGMAGLIFSLFLLLIIWYWAFKK